ncbi:hypothetical protein [Streptomyces bullii]|uniref:Uncharacterized protein n=1 Tax=Streptomyces bullii TaxID=349910 RepID=A0ABW0V1X6_9ACTN
MPPAAEERLAERGMTVLPDVVVNVGTYASRWTLFGDVAPAPGGVGVQRRSMREPVELMLDRAAADGTTPRPAAHSPVDDRLPLIAEHYGCHW